MIKRQVPEKVRLKSAYQTPEEKQNSEREGLESDTPKRSAAEPKKREAAEINQKQSLPFANVEAKRSG